MKSLIRILADTKFGIFFRNLLNISPVLLKIPNSKYPIAISDAFAWRTDNGYKTKFRYSDILNMFYKIKNSYVEFHIYSKNNELLKTEKFSNLGLCNEFEITSEYLDNLEDYGVFYIYHFTETKLSDNIVISNRCYLGYSLNNNLYSFVHGNTLGKYTQIKPGNEISTDIVKTSMIKNQHYKIQKLFDELNKNELFFSNPTSKIIRFSINNKSYKLKSGHSEILPFKGETVTIKSNCAFLRPTIFSYRDEYLDVHHS